MLPFTKSSTENSANSTNDFMDSTIAREKVMRDIAFLHDKLNVIKAQTNPNLTLIDHYNCMLKSREDVLNWLESTNIDSINRMLRKKHIA